jgi:hypothetical protein
VVLFALELRRAVGGTSKPPRVGRRPIHRTWLAAGASLSAIYVAQEITEGMLSDGHPPGLAGVVGSGGWTAFLLAFAVGAVIAFALRGADAIVLRASRDGGGPRPRCDFIFDPPRARDPRPLDAVARNLAGRGPPLISA